MIMMLVLSIFYLCKGFCGRRDIDKQEKQKIERSTSVDVSSMSYYGTLWTWSNQIKRKPTTLPRHNNNTKHSLSVIRSIKALKRNKENISFWKISSSSMKKWNLKLWTVGLLLYAYNKRNRLPQTTKTQ